MKVDPQRAATAVSTRDPAPPDGARILLIDDDAALLRLLSRRLRDHGYRIASAGSAEEALACMATERFDLVISDMRLPGTDGLALFGEIRSTCPALPVILLTGHGTIEDAVEATSRGVFAYITKPFDSRALLSQIEQALRMSGAVPDDGTATRDTAWCEEIISHSARMQSVLDEAQLVAASDASILIQGESGTGKELLARAIHRASPRADAPFVAINCGAIPENLLESELFGHARGAFTGAATAHTGLFVAANRGTLFLDEIGDMPLALQVKLLRVLQERAVRPVGSTRAEPIDVRIISATHRDLEAARAAGHFREDLFYRLNVVTLSLPSLEERREDIPLLASLFLQGLARKYHKRLHGFAPEALQALASAGWPGNVRQLQNVVEQACALATTPLIPLALVERALRGSAHERLSYAEARQRFERDYLIRILKLTDGNVSDAARLADRNRTEFYRLLQRHALTPGLFRAGYRQSSRGARKLAR